MTAAPAAEGALTIRSALTAGEAALAAAGVETPLLDARLLLSHALDQSRTYLFAHPGDPVPPEMAARFRELLGRRADREPLPYLLGRWEFLGMPFRVSPAVLIPRPETETLVEAAAARLAPGARVLDVGTGSGCIAVGLARMASAVVVALEASPAAAAVARENVASLGAVDRVEVRVGRFPSAAAGLGRFDAVVSNPPYIPSAEVERLAPELREYEPRFALDGGVDGLSLLRALVEHSPALLRPGGLLAVEVAAGQAERVAVLFLAEAGWAVPELLPDLGGVLRVVLCRRG